MAAQNSIPIASVTNVDTEGPFLRISAQLDKTTAQIIEKYIASSLENFQRGIGSVQASDLSEGVICCARYKDGGYYRAKIINASSNCGQVEVDFIDFGNKDTISVSTIRYLDKYPPCLSQTPPLSCEFIVAGVFEPSGKWDEHLLMKVHRFLCYTEKPYIVLKSIGRYVLASFQHGAMNLAEHLTSNGYGVPISLEQQITILQQILEPDKDSSWLNGNPPPMSNFQQLQSMNQPVSTFSMPQPNLSQPPPNLANNQKVRASPTLSAISQRLNVNRSVTMSTLQNRKVPIAGQTVSYTQPNSISTPMAVPTPPLSLPMYPPPRGVTMPLHGQIAHVGMPPASLQTSIKEQPPTQLTTPTVVDAHSVSPPRQTAYHTRKLDVHSKHSVFVSYSENGPELFAVQLTKENEALNKMMDEINKRPHHSLTEPPIIGSVCLGRMSGDRIICRAVVKNISGSQCTLYFVDFGDTENVNYYDIFDIPDEYVAPPAFALCFCLSGVKKLTKGPSMVETFKALVRSKVAVLKVTPQEGPPLLQYGELYIEGKSVLDLLLEAQVEIALTYTPIGMLDMGTTTSALVSYVDSCIRFFIQLAEHTDELNEVMDAVAAHCESSSPPDNVNEGLTCCAKFPDDNNWYRALVLKVNNGKALVAYTDYGNEQEVDFSDLRTITPELIELPAQALKCALKGFETKPVEVKTSNQLEMLALEKTLTVKVVGTLSSDTMLVTLIDENVHPPMDIAAKMIELAQPRKITENLKQPSNAEDREMANVKIERNSQQTWSDRHKVSRESNKQQSASGSNDNFTPASHNIQNDEWDEAPQVEESNERSFSRSRSDRYEAGPRYRNNNEGRGNYRSREDSNRNDEDSKTRDGGSFRSRDEGSFKNRDDGGFKNRDGGGFKNRDDKGFRNRDDGSFRNKGERSFKNRDDEGFKNNDDGGYKPRDDRREDYRRRDDSRENRFRSDKPERKERERSNFNPRDRAEKLNRSFGSDDGEKPFRKKFEDREGYIAPNKPRSKFTQVTTKPLPNPVPLDNAFSEESIEANSVHEVTITWFVSPHNIYVQIASLQPRFLSAMQRIPEIYKNVRPYTGFVTVGSSVLAKYPEDGVLYRATVLSVESGNKFIVQYVDFGNKYLVDGKDIWQLDQALMEVPKMAINIALSGVSPIDGEWKISEEIDQCFSAPQYQCVFGDCVEGKYSVTLWDDDKNIADMLIERNLAVKEGTTSFVDEAVDLYFLVGQQVICRVSHIASYDEIYIHLDLRKVENVENMLSKYDASKLIQLPEEMMTAGTHCILKHDSKIFRAIILEKIDDKQLKVVLPDYGNTLITTAENVNTLPPELSVYLYQSTPCRLNNLTEDVTRLMTDEDLTNELKGKQLIVYINDVDENRLMVTFYNLQMGKKLCLFEPDEGAYDEVTPLCQKAVLRSNFGSAYMSHIENPDEVYLQNSAESDELSEMLDALYKYYSEGSSEALENCKADAVCAAKSSDGNWYRAIISSVAETECEVQFTDYGNRETVPLTSIRKLDSKFHEPCAFALLVTLGCENKEPTIVQNIIDITTDKILEVNLSNGDNGWIANIKVDTVDLLEKVLGSQEKLASSDEITTKPSVNSDVQVYVSHVENPGEFWLQMADQIDKIDYIQNELQEKADSFNNLETLNPGCLGVAKYSADEVWYRISIENIIDGDVTVRFIDYGNTDVIKNTCELIKEMPESLAAIPGCCQKCRVNALPANDNIWSEDAKKCFLDLLDDLSVPLTARINTEYGLNYTDLYVSGINITESLIREGHAKVVDATNEQLLHDLVPAQNIEEAFIVHIEDPSEVYIQMNKDGPKIEEIQALLQEEAETFPKFEDRLIGKLCVCKYMEDLMWYRAVIKQVNCNKTVVQFIDYGNTDEIDCDDYIRQMPLKLLDIQPLALKIELNIKPLNSNEWTSKEVNIFKEVLGDLDEAKQVVVTPDKKITNILVNGRDVTDLILNSYGDCFSHKETLSSQSVTKLPEIDSNHTDKTYIQKENVQEVEISETSNMTAQANEEKDLDYKNDSSSEKLIETSPQSSNLESILAKKSNETLFEPNSEEIFSVCISHIDSPGQFWLQTTESITKIEAIQAELQELGDSYSKLKKITEGDICVAKYAGNGLWHRAQVIDYDDEITTVRFIDYGYTDIFESNSDLLKEIPDHLNSSEGYAIKCSLDASPGGTGNWSDTASDYFIEMVGDTTKAAKASIVLQDEITFVNLYIGDVDLTEKLVSEGYGVKTDRTTGRKFKCFASHINSPAEFWIQLESAITELKSIEELMADCEYLPNLINQDETSICAARYPEDGCWYRAQIMTSGSEGTEVLFIDYGNSSLVSELKELPQELKDKPALTRKCALQKPRSLKTWSQKSEELFHQLAAEGATVFEIRFIASGDPSIVDLWHNNTSVTQHLLKFCNNIECEEVSTVSHETIELGSNIDFSDAQIDDELNYSKDSVDTVVENACFEGDKDTSSDFQDALETSSENNFEIQTDVKNDFKSEQDHDDGIIGDDKIATRSNDQKTSDQLQLQANASAELSEGNNSNDKLTSNDKIDVSAGENDQIQCDEIQLQAISGDELNEAKINDNNLDNLSLLGKNERKDNSNDYQDALESASERNFEIQGDVKNDVACVQDYDDDLNLKSTTNDYVKQNNSLRNDIEDEKVATSNNDPKKSEQLQLKTNASADINEGNTSKDNNEKMKASVDENEQIPCGEIQPQAVSCDEVKEDKINDINPDNQRSLEINEQKDDEDEVNITVCDNPKGDDNNISKSSPCSEATKPFNEDYKCETISSDKDNVKEQTNLESDTSDNEEYKINDHPNENKLSKKDNDTESKDVEI